MFPSHHLFLRHPSLSLSLLYTTGYDVACLAIMLIAAWRCCPTTIRKEEEEEEAIVMPSLDLRKVLLQMNAVKFVGLLPW
jgi:hypothetical protein